MKKKLISMAMMAAMTLAIMPVTLAHAEDIDGTQSSTYKLTGNKTDQLVITKGDVTLDLNGNSITVDGKSAIVVDSGASLTITDTSTSGEGKINVTSSNALSGGAILVNTNATLTVEKGNFAVQNTDVINNSGVATINGGTFSGTGHFGYPILYNGGSTSAVKLTVNNGTFNGGFNSSNSYQLTAPAIENEGKGTIYVNGGVYKDFFVGVYNGSPLENINGSWQHVPSYAFISGGEFSAPDRSGTDTTYGAGGSIINYGYMEVTGGTFSSYTGLNAIELSHTDLANNDGTKGQSLIYGGTFNGKVADPNSSSTVYAGTFNDSTLSVVPFVSKNSTYTTANDITKVTATTVMSVKQNVYFDSTPSDLTFTYSIANVEGKADNELIQDASATGSDQVYNGITPNAVTLSGLTDETKKSLTLGLTDYNVAAATTADQKTAYDNKEKVSSKTFMINFEGVTFPEAGIYRYVITATANDDAKVTDATKTQKRYLDVWVKKYLDNSLHVEGMVMHSTADLHVTTGTTDNKVYSFDAVSSQKSLNLTVNHHAGGKQASKLESYNYTLTMGNGIAGSSITWQKGTESGAVTAFNSEKSTTYSFSLKDGESIIFKCIPEGASYTVSVTDASKATMIKEGLATVVNFEKDYSTSTTGTDSDVSTDESAVSSTTKAIAVSAKAASETAVADSIYSVSDTNLTANTTIGFTGYKDGTIPTGVILTVAPYAVLLAAGFFGLIIFMKKRKEEPEEE